MRAVLARDSGSVATAARARMPRADAHPRPRRRATARSHGVSSESVISRSHRSIDATTVCRRKLPAAAQASARARPPGIAYRENISLDLLTIPAGWRSLAPLPRKHGSRGVSVTARAIPLMAGSKHCEGSSFAANMPGCNGTACRMASCEWGGNGRRISPRGFARNSMRFAARSMGAGAFRLRAHCELRQI
jgi:hypothetical protein